MPRPNLRVVPKLDAFEQAMREDPPQCPGSRLAAFWRSDALLSCGIGLAALLISCAGLWGILVYVLGARP